MNTIQVKSLQSTDPDMIMKIAKLKLYFEQTQTLLIIRTQWKELIVLKKIILKSHTKKDWEKQIKDEINNSIIEFFSEKNNANANGEKLKRKWIGRNGRVNKVGTNEKLGTSAREAL